MFHFHFAFSYFIQYEMGWNVTIDSWALLVIRLEGL